MESMTASPATAPAPAPARRRRRGLVILLVALGVVVLLVVAAEVLLRGLIDDRLRSAEADLPEGVSVERDGTPALWQVARGHAALRVDVAPEALTDMARDATELPGLEVEAESGTLVAQVPLPVQGSTRTVDLLLDVAAEGGRAVVRADTVRFAGLSLPVATVAQQLGSEDLGRLAEGVAFPEGESDLAISSARTTPAGLELGAQVAMW